MVWDLHSEESLTAKLYGQTWSDYPVDYYVDSVRHLALIDHDQYLHGIESTVSYLRSLFI